LLPILVKAEVYCKTYANGQVFYCAKAVFRHKANILGLFSCKYNLVYWVKSWIDCDVLALDGDSIMSIVEFTTKDMAMDSLVNCIQSKCRDWLSDKVVSFKVELNE
jgi:hypothetical protein